MEHTITLFNWTLEIRYLFLIIMWIAGAIMSMGTAFRISNNLKYLVITKKRLFFYIVTSWIGYTMLLVEETSFNFINPLEENQPKLQFRLMQRYANGRRIYDTYNQK